MLDKPVRLGVFAFLKSTLALLVILHGATLTTSAFALVGGGSPDLVASFTQNLGGGSSVNGLQPANANNPNYINSTAGTLITFDPSNSFLPVSTNPNQTFLYQLTWDFGDVVPPPPDTLVVPTAGPLDPTIPSNLVVLLAPVSHAYLQQGVYGPINVGSPSNSTNTGPKLTIQQFVQTAVTVNATATNGSAILTGLTSTTGIAVGGTISGVGIQGNTTVISFSATTLTMSLPAVVAIPISATSTAGSNVLTGVTNTVGLALGAIVTGPGIPANTTITALTANTITLSKPATTSSVPGTFSINAVQGPYNINLLQPGTSSVATGTVMIADINYPPQPSLINIGSQPTPGGVPVTVTASNSFDPDGYILYAAIDWGDGTAQLVPQPTGPALPAPGSTLPLVEPPAFIQLLPNPPAIPNTNGFDIPGIPISHVYASPGSYVVTLSVIDNGRLIPNPNVLTNPTPPPTNVPQPIPFPLTTVPGPTDPYGALASIKQFFMTTTTYGQEGIPNHKFDPQLAQTFLTVNVPGGLPAASSTFSVDFKKSKNDKLNLTLTLNDTTPIDTLANSVITLSIVNRLGALGNAATFTFNTNSRSRTAGNSNVSFSFNPKKRTITLALKGVSLHDNTTGGALLTKDQTIDNGGIDARIGLTINGATNIVSYVRYEYTSQSGTSGKGKNGHAIPGGSIQ